SATYASMRDSVLKLAGPAFTSQEQPGVRRIAATWMQYLHIPSLTVAAGAYVRRLESACQLLQSELLPPRAPTPVAPPIASHIPSAAGNLAAGELCRLLLTDSNILDVVLALHDIRAAQLCYLMPCPYDDAIKLPAPGEALAKQLSKSRRSVPSINLLSFVKILNRDTSLEGDPLLRVWDSMHRAMLLVLAALQSLPIRPHPQHPDPADNTHTSITTQLLPGYHRCSACLLLSLRLVLNLGQHCAEQPLGKDSALARLHNTLPGLLLGLSTAMTVMQAAGHPEEQAQRVQFVRCLLDLMLVIGAFSGDGELAMGMDITLLFRESLGSCPQQLAHKLSSSTVVTGWPGALVAAPSRAGSSATNSGSRFSSSSRSSNSRGQGSSSSSGAHSDDPRAIAAVVNSYAHAAQALCAVLGRHEEPMSLHLVIRTCRSEGVESLEELQRIIQWGCIMTRSSLSREMFGLKFVHSVLSSASVPRRAGAGAGATAHSSLAPHRSLAPLLDIAMGVLLRSLVVLETGVVMLRLAAASLYPPWPDLDALREAVEPFIACCLPGVVNLLARILTKLTEFLPDWRSRRIMLRALVRTASAAAHAHSALEPLLNPANTVPTTSKGESKARVGPVLLHNKSEVDEMTREVLPCATSMWNMLLSVAYQGNLSSVALEQLMKEDGIPILVPIDKPAAGDEEVLPPPPSVQQLAPLALDLVWGMEGMLQVLRCHRLMYAHVRERGATTARLVDGYRALLALFGHVIEVLAEPAAVGPSGLAAQPASWLPCGNSLVEGWCTRLLAETCQLFRTSIVIPQDMSYNLKVALCQGLVGSHELLLRGRQQAPLGMSSTAQQLLACLVVVLTVAAPLHLSLSEVKRLPTTGTGPVGFETRNVWAVRAALAQLQPERVWTWQALAAGTPAESALAQVLQTASLKLTLPHLCAPPPQGWQAGKPTLAVVEDIQMTCFRSFFEFHRRRSSPDMGMMSRILGETFGRY
ncbi:hypothetical protein QJQ45_024321, partial [Haematococcus lacustris]